MRASHFLAASALIWAVSCADPSVIEGIDMDIRIDAPFAGSDSVVATVSPTDTPGYSDVAGAVSCVQIDLTNSFALINSVQGGDGGSFTLTATIISGTDETQMLTWKGTLETSQNQTLFTSDLIEVTNEANQALTAIYQEGAPWQLRMNLDANTLPDLLSIRIAPRLIVNTAEGGCN